MMSELISVTAGVVTLASCAGSVIAWLRSRLAAREAGAAREAAVRARDQTRAVLDGVSLLRRVSDALSAGRETLALLRGQNLALADRAAIDLRRATVRLREDLSAAEVAGGALLFDLAVDAAAVSDLLGGGRRMTPELRDEATATVTTINDRLEGLAVRAEHAAGRVDAGSDGASQARSREARQGQR